MAIQTYDHETGLLILNQNNDYTQSRLEAHPLTAALAPPFAELRAQRWIPTLLQELSLQYAINRARARVLQVESLLNGLVKKLDGALWMLTHGDTTAPLYQKYFGTQRPSEINAILMGARLAKIQGWISSLLTSPHVALQGIGAEIQSAVAAADVAVEAQKAADAALADFATTGQRAQTIDAFNALRKATWGKLGEIQHQNPEIASGFADLFFLHEVRRRDDKLSSEQIRTKVSALEEDLATWKAKLDKALAREQKDADDAAASAAREAELAEKRRQAEALAAEIKRLEGK